MLQANNRNGRRANTLSDVQRLLSLFQAFRERDEKSFYRTAEALIDEQLAANHHELASDLRRALGTRAAPIASTEKNGLRTLPRDRRSNEPLMRLVSPIVDAPDLILTRGNRRQMERIVEEWEMRGKLSRYGYRPKSRLLFWGPPGCGKTLAAHNLAVRLNLPMGVVQLSALISSFLGDTASHIARIFQEAQDKPMVLLLDEFDAIGKDRDDAHDVGELKRVVNSLLQALDGFSSVDSILIAASNHQHMLDSAIWRRFEDVVQFAKPSPQERELYLRRLLNGVEFKGDLATVVRLTSGLTFAEIERLVTESVKTMILADKERLASSVLISHIKQFRKSAVESRHHRNES